MEFLSKAKKRTAQTGEIFVSAILPLIALARMGDWLSGKILSIRQKAVVGGDRKHSRIWGRLSRDGGGRIAAMELMMCGVGFFQPFGCSRSRMGYKRSEKCRHFHFRRRGGGAKKTGGAAEIAKINFIVLIRSPEKLPRPKAGVFYKKSPPIDTAFFRYDRKYGVF